jgi:ribonuclease E
MTKKMLIDATHAEETRVVVLDGNKVDEFDFESLNKRQLAGNIYLAKVTRVEPSLQAAFIDYGGNRHGFLAFSEVHPDYYQIPKADREALLAEEAALASEVDEEPAAAREVSEPKPRGRSRSRKRSVAAGEGTASSQDAVIAGDATETEASAPQDKAAAPDGSQDAGAAPDGSQDAGAAPDGSPSEAEADDHTHASQNEAFGGSEGVDGDVLEAIAEQEAGRSEDAGDEGPMLVETPEDMAASNDFESVGGQESARDEQPVRKSRPRRYKIQEVIKVRQILLVQVIKEERGNKGAALTTYLSLAGRYCVLMPNTARGGGISRKITNAADRKKLKEISNSITVPQGAGLIIRTAGANRTKTEIKRDYEYLLRQWEQIRDLTLKSIAPCLIYEEGSLIKRVIRDLYSREIDEVLVDGERGYREAKDYMKMLMPSHAKNVKHHAEALPLFSRFQVENYLAGMFNPVVQLKSGGYIVIDVTEALVAIDVNSGRATREASIEDTALKTNLEAAEEAARQMRLRDLAGLIVIDFIDMDERKNNLAVEKRLKEKLKTDRARIQIGRISAFGLLEMSRQRLRPGMIEATTKGCPHCHGTGRVRSDDSVALALLREVEEEGVRQRSKEVLVCAPVDIANYLLNQKREHIIRIESRFGLSVRVEGDAALINPDYRIERFKTASRIITVPEGLPLPILPLDIDEVEEPDEAEEEEAISEQAAAEQTAAEQAATEQTAAEQAAGEKSQPKKKRRRRRRGGSKTSRDGSEDQQADASDPSGDETTEDQPTEPAGQAETHETDGPDAVSAATDDGEDRAAPVDPETAPDSAQGVPPPARADAFGEVIDPVSEPPADIVSVPESDTGGRPGRRPRVSQPAAAVIAGVKGVAPDAITEPAPTEAEPSATLPDSPAPEPAADDSTPEGPGSVGPETAPDVESQPPVDEAAHDATQVDQQLAEDLAEAALEPSGQEGGPHPAEEEPATETETEAGELLGAAAEDGSSDASDGRKRRGWWSRASGGAI